MASGGPDAGAVAGAPFVLGEGPGAIVAGFDMHRRQITIEALDTATGEVSRGQIESTPAAFEERVANFPGPVEHVAVEARTGWLFVCRTLERCGASRIGPSRWRPARCGSQAHRREMLSVAIAGRAGALTAPGISAPLDELQQRAANVDRLLQP